MIRGEVTKMSDAIKAETFSNELGGSGLNAPTLGSKVDTVVKSLGNV